MSILVDQHTRLVVQGITGREGSFHAQQMLDYGTQVVAGVTPGKGGSSVAGLPVYDTVREAVASQGANTSIIYVPARFAPEAIYEAADAGIGLIVCITEGIPVWDMVRVARHVKAKGARLLGPNSPGLISPGQAKVGIMPGHIHQPGSIGMVSRSGTLTYEMVWSLSQAGWGQSTCVGIGGDPIIGTDFVDVLALLEADAQTKAMVLIGEIGGRDEELAAEFIRDQVSKPVVALIAGRAAPPDRRMGHAGAIIAGGTGTARAKIQALREAHVVVADHPEQVPEKLADLLGHEGEA